MLVVCQRRNKTDLIDGLRSDIKDSGDVFFVEYRGLSVESMKSLRCRLKKTGAFLKVIKNTFLKMAFDGLGQEGEINSFFTGPNAVVFAKEDSCATAKELVRFSKEVPLLVIKGGLVSGQIYGEKRLFEYSALLSKIELITMFARVLNEPVAQLARVLQAVCDMRFGN